MSEEGLLIALLKSGCSFAELHKSNSDNAEIERLGKILMNYEINFQDQK